MSRAGIIDQNIERAEGRQRLRDSSRKDGFSRHVATHRDRVVADGAGRGFRRVEIDVGDSDACALFRVSFGDAFADAGD